MTFLPLIERQLRARSRQRAFYWSRLSIVLLGTLIVIPQLLVDIERASAARTGAAAFNTITALLFALCCGAGALTASAIIEEQNEGTLGLLYLTRVSAFDITAGALGTAGFTCLWMLLAFVPLITIPILAGGVSANEALRKVAALIATLILSLALGLRTPAGSSRWARQTFAPVLLLITFTVFAFPLSPVAAFSNAAEATFRAAPHRYWQALGVTLALAPLIFLSAVRTLRSSTKDFVATSPPSTVHSKRSKKANPFAFIPDTTNPIQLVVERDGSIKAALWLGAVIGVLFGGTFFMVFSRFLNFSSGSFVYSLGVFFYSGTILQTALFAWAATRTIHTMQHSGEMELLLTTPVGAKNIVSGLLTGLKRVVRGPVILMIAPTVIVLIVYTATPLAVWPWPSNSFMFFQISNSITTVLHTIFATAAIIWLGLWFGLTTRKIAVAVLYTVLVAKGIPLVLGQIFSFIFNQMYGPSSYSVAGGPPLSFWMLRLIPAVISLVTLFLLMRWARRRIAGKFVR